MGVDLLWASGSDNAEKALIFNVQRFALHDGPGIRTTVFLKGCPLRCKWCANPESINNHPEIMTFDMKCIRCGKCLEVCKTKAISVVQNMRKIDRAKCNACLECARVCPSGAIQQVGTLMTVEQVVEEVQKDKPFYVNSSGGVTFSGGEPLAQWRFVRKVCRRCKEEDIHIALDTTGYTSWEYMEKVLEYVDLVLYDIKHLDSLVHKEGTGVGNELILENLERTSKVVRTWVRIPVISEYNDSFAFMNSVGELCASLGVEKVSLLPYHEWGVQKYDRIGKAYTFNGAKAPAEEIMVRGREIIESFGCKVSIGR